MQEVFRASPTDLRRRRHRADRLVADGGLALRLPVLPGYDWDEVRPGLAARPVPGVAVVDGNIYRRTITVGSQAGLFEVAPGEPGNLVLRLHLPYWEGLIHLVGRIAGMLGADADQRPGLAVPGAWTSFEAGVGAIARRGRDGGAAARWLGSFAASLGTPVPGLPGGLTHAFPEAVTLSGLASAGIESEEAEAIAALAAASLEDRRDHGTPSVIIADGVP
jgi:AraC family transcriptional regulator of adaptative response / DNA-3-methyladenine glycosylase II